MAKYMLIMRPTDESFANFMQHDFAEILESVGKFNDELIRAGVLLSAEGLDDPKESVVVDFTGETPIVTDGPYGETKELFSSAATTSWTSRRSRRPSNGRSGHRSRRAARPRSGG